MKLTQERKLDLIRTEIQGGVFWIMSTGMFVYLYLRKQYLVSVTDFVIFLLTAGLSLVVGFIFIKSTTER